MNDLRASLRPFEKVNEASDDELRTAFGEAIAGIFGTRRGPGQLRDPSQLGPGRRRGTGQRGEPAQRRPRNPDMQIMPEQTARIETAFNRFVYEGADFSPALLAIAIMPAQSGSSDSTLDDSAPPERSKHKKYGGLSVRATALNHAAEKIRLALEEPRSEGRSQAFIDNVVYPTLTPKKLKINKIVKNKILARLIVRTLVSSDQNLELKNAFVSSLVLACLPRAQPDLMLFQLSGGSDSRNTIEQIRKVVLEHHRYQNRTTLALLDVAGNRALLIGPRLPAGLRVTEPLSLRDLSATLFGQSNVEAEFAQGKPVDIAVRN